MYGRHTQYHSNARRRESLVLPRQATPRRALSQLGRDKEDALACVVLDRELPLKTARQKCRMHGCVCNHLKEGWVGKNFLLLLSSRYQSRGGHEGRLGAITQIMAAVCSAACYGPSAINITLTPKFRSSLRCSSSVRTRFVLLFLDFARSFLAPRMKRELHLREPRQSN